MVARIRVAHTIIEDAIMEEEVEQIMDMIAKPIF